MKFKLSDKAKAVLASVAPTLGTALAGPFGGLAGSILAKVVGGESVASEEQTIQALEAQSPEAVLKLREAELALKAEMKRLEISEDQLVYQDIQNARERETRLGGDQTTRILAFTVVGSFVAATIAVLLEFAKVESVLAGTLIGYLSAKAEQVIAYYFGSSKGSKDKTDALAKAAAR